MENENKIKIKERFRKKGKVFTTQQAWFLVSSYMIGSYAISEEVGTLPESKHILIMVRLDLLVIQVLGKNDIVSSCNGPFCCVL